MGISGDKRGYEIVGWKNGRVNGVECVSWAILKSHMRFTVMNFKSLINNWRLVCGCVFLCSRIQ